MNKSLLSTFVFVSQRHEVLPSPGCADFDAGDKAYDRADYKTALKEWRPLADFGDAEAQNKLGVLYALGEGVPQDYIEAARWYRRAAEQGHAHAQYNLGIMYSRGLGLPQDYAQALVLFNRSVAQGIEKAPIRSHVRIEMP